MEKLACWLVVITIGVAIIASLPYTWMLLLAALGLYGLEAFLKRAGFYKR